MAENVKYDSKEERYFSYYVDELLEAGYLVSAEYHPTTFELCSETTVLARTTKRNKSVDKSIKLTGKHVYTADWELRWNPQISHKMYWSDLGDKSLFYSYEVINEDSLEVDYYMSLVDVKGGFNGKNNNSAVTFPINQKWVMDKFGIFVQKIVVSTDKKSIFAKTFTPRKVVEEEVYKKDNIKRGIKAGDPKLKYKPISLEQYVYNQKCR